MKYTTLLTSTFSIAVLLTGCGERTSEKTKEQQGASSATVAATTVAEPVATVPQKATYEATLAEGIDFKREGYPTFVAKTTGISEKESFGRWSDGDEIIIDLVDPLPNKFTITLKAAAFIPNVGKPFKMIIGETQQNFVIDTGSPENMKIITIPFKTRDGAKSIHILVPQATSPKALVNSTDERRLGIALGLFQIIK